MQIDMHFYGAYALSRAAGITPQTASVIAYASQFVDDAIDDEAIVLELPGRCAILPTMTSHKPIDYQNTLPGDQWKVWVPFHFLPGNDDTAATFVGKMVCLKNSEPAKMMLAHVVNQREAPFGPHLAGIAAHIYADTFSHYGVVGLGRDWNRVRNESIEIRGSDSIRHYLWERFEEFKTRLAGSLAETIPVGHGSVGTFPDRPYLSWEYEYEPLDKYEPRRPVVRNNADDYMEACEGLYTFFSKFITDAPAYGDPAAAVPWASVADTVFDIVTAEGTRDERVSRWKKAIAGGKLFDPAEEDRTVDYDARLWKSAHISECLSKEETATGNDACLFFKAAWMHRHYVLHQLLSSIGVIRY